MRIFLLYKRKLALVLSLVFLLIVIGIIGTTDRIQSVFQHNDKLIPIYRVYTPEKKIAISFDAAWGSDKTPAILNLLKKHGVKTTFFLVGFWVEDYPEMAKRIAEEGHEIGNHSSTHPTMGGLSAEKVLEELEKAHETIKGTTGFEPCIFRPPFGDYSNTLIRTSEEYGYKVIQWDVDSLDWKNFSSEAIIDRVMSQVTNGSIVLFHNNGKHTPEAVDVILSKLISKGYKIVPVSELLIEGEYYIDHTGEQKPISN
ncbi:MAG TPA: polysaccharide deacetylase family protein [Thermoanaerobacterales bacterium]|nr:polysaccharide deacetylase family protein [Thermoanaerobacterales bacterium]